MGFTKDYGQIEIKFIEDKFKLILRYSKKISQEKLSIFLDSKENLTEKEYAEFCFDNNLDFDSLKNQAFIKSLNILNLKQEIKKGTKPKDWIMSINQDGEELGFISQGSIVMVGAVPKSGKSWFLMDIGLSISEGRKWAGHIDCKQKKIMYIEKEMGRDSAVMRLKRLAHNKNYNLENFVFYADSLLNVQQSNATEFLRSLILETGAEVVFIDSLSRIFFGNENDSQDAKFVFECLKPIKDELGTTFIIVHHCKKNNYFNGKKQGSDMDMFRGSGDFVAQVDSLFALDKWTDQENLNEQTRVLKVVAHRDMDESRFKNMKFILSDNDNRQGISINYTGDVEYKKESKEESPSAMLSRSILNVLPNLPKELKNSVLEESLLEFDYSNDSYRKAKRQLLREGCLKLGKKKGWLVNLKSGVAEENVVFEEVVAEEENKVNPFFDSFPDKFGLNDVLNYFESDGDLAMDFVNKHLTRGHIVAIRKSQYEVVKQ